jgi:type I restriction enzyme M protein
VETVISLGPNLFYSSPMESCIVVCNRNKLQVRKHKVLFIDAFSEVTRERAQSCLKPENHQRILGAYQAFADQSGFAKVVMLAVLRAQACNLSVSLYLKRLPSPAGRGELKLSA